MKMKKNFEIGQSNEIIKADEIFDLHNLYDFVGIFLKGDSRQLRILFEPNLEHATDEPPLSFNFEAIDYLEFSPNFGAKIISGLDELGYKNPKDRNIEWLIDEKHSTPEDHLFFRMDGGDFIRVHCQNINLVEVTKLISI